MRDFLLPTNHPTRTVGSLGLGGKYARKHVPEKLRHIIAAESAANDGMAYPFLSISIYLTVESSWRVAIAKWFLVGWLCKFLSTLTSTSIALLTLDD